VKAAAAPSGNMTSNVAEGDTALRNKGDALYSQGNYPEAIIYYDKALAIDPNNKDYLQWKQNALSKMGR
jgi:tetratricopeptide (TPR) repeat protein